jgi:hypothetical protein
MKYFLFLACFWYTTASGQIAVGASRVADYETQSVKSGNIEKTEELGKAGFDMKFKYLLGYSKELKGYFFRLIDATAEKEKGFYHSITFGEQGKYYTAKDIGLSFDETTISRISITGIWQFKNKEFKGTPINITIPEGIMQSKQLLTPPPKFSENHVLYGALKLVDVEFNSWETTDKAKWIDLVEKRIKQ